MIVERLLMAEQRDPVARQVPDAKESEQVPLLLRPGHLVCKHALEASLVGSTILLEVAPWSL